MINHESQSQKYTFGNEPSFNLTFLRTYNREVLKGDLHLERPAIVADIYQNALEDINRTWRVVEDSSTGQQFEIAEAGQDDGSGEVDVEIATYTSSLSGNAGNAEELAKNAAANRRRVYVTPPGNGKSSYWTAEEQKYIKQTGRFINEDGQPLPTIAALNRVLRGEGYTVTKASTNSMGGALATALMHASPEGQFTHAYQKSRTNISNHAFSLAWGIGVMIGDILDDRKYQKNSKDPWKLTGETVDAAKARIPNVYSEDDEVNKAAQIEADSAFGPKKLWNDMVALSKGSTRGGLNPAAADTIAAQQQQPDAFWTFHMPEQDRLYKSYEDIATFMVQASTMSDPQTGVHLDRNNKIQVLLNPGGHRDHTSYPTLRWAAERYALNREV